MKYANTEIKKRTDGRWYARYKLYNGIYKYIYGKTQLECYEKVKLFANDKKLVKKCLRDLNSKKSGTQKCLLDPNAKNIPPKTTFGEFWETWLKQEKMPKCKQSTIRVLKSKYKLYLCKLADRPIDEITANEVRTLLNGITSESTRDRCHIILADIFRNAVNYDLIQNSVMNKITHFKYKEKPRQPFTIEEERLFVKEAEKSNCALIFFLMLYEGLRTSEAKAITPSDIKDDYIIVDKSINDYGDFISTKTNNRRIVPIFDKFKPYANKYRGTSTTPCLGKVNKHTAVDEYREIQKITGIKKQMYSLRHTFATRCEEAGISVKQTAQWMGHANIQTTLNNYIGIQGAFEKENIKKKNDIN